MMSHGESLKSQPCPVTASILQKGGELDLDAGNCPGVRQDSVSPRPDPTSDPKSLLRRTFNL